MMPHPPVDSLHVGRTNRSPPRDILTDLSRVTVALLETEPIPHLGQRLSPGPLREGDGDLALFPRRHDLGHEHGRLSRGLRPAPQQPCRMERPVLPLADDVLAAKGPGVILKVVVLQGQTVAEAEARLQHRGDEIRRAGVAHDARRVFRLGDAALVRVVEPRSCGSLQSIPPAPDAT